jgi:hypothetical protein
MGQFSPRAADPQTARFQPKPGMGQPLQGQKPPMGGFKPPPMGGGVSDARGRLSAGAGGFGGGWDPNGFTNGGLAQIGRAAGGMQQNPWDGTMFGMSMQGGGGGGQGGGLQGIGATGSYSQDAINADPQGFQQYLQGRQQAMQDPRYQQGGNMGGRSFGDLLGGFGGFGAPAGGGMQGGPVPGQSVAPPEQFGPGDQGPGNYAGMSGSDIFARLFGQRP